MGAIISRTAPEVSAEQQLQAAGPPQKQQPSGDVVTTKVLHFAEPGPTKNDVSLFEVEEDGTYVGDLVTTFVDESGPAGNCIKSKERQLARNTTLAIEQGSPADILHELIKGNARFVLGKAQNPHQDFSRIQAIAPQQRPMAAILACADSRVPIELLFDQGFGDLFVCRIAGNIATAEEIASLEYAVLDLGVKVIMIMGHTNCGAVKAALSGRAFPGFIDMLVDHLDVAVVRAQTRNSKNYDQLKNSCSALHADHGLPEPCILDQVIRENVLYQIDRCKRSALILDSVKTGKLLLVPAIYNLETSEVEIMQ